MAEAKTYLHRLVHDLHNAIVATIDENGFPVTCAIDMMDVDDEGVYFLTGKGKSFYTRLVRNPVIALTAMKGEDTMSMAALSLQGKVREVGPERLMRLFELNPYMYDIFPTEESRRPMTVFCIYEGHGEWFDLSRLPIEREDFAFGGDRIPEDGYLVSDRCTGCGACLTSCAHGCIGMADGRAVIRQENCLRCGCCRADCPCGAIDRLDK